MNIYGVTKAGQAIHHLDDNGIVEFPNGNILLSGNSGSWELRTSNLKFIKNGTWIHGSSYYIRVAKLLSDGNILLAGGVGRWELLDSNLVSIKSGVWTHTPADTSGNIHTVAILKNGNILLAGGGNAGRWQMFDSSMNSITSGWWSHSNTIIYTSKVLDNGNIFFAGNAGAMQLLTPAMASIKLSTWTWGSSYAIYTSTVLQNGNIVVSGGSTGYYQVLTPDTLSNVANGVWSKGTGYSIFSLATLPNGDVIAAGEQGAIEIYSENMVKKLYLSSWTWIWTASYTINTIKVLNNGDILFGGVGGRFQRANIDALQNSKPTTGTVSSTASIGQFGSNGIIELPNGNIILTGTGGLWEILSPNRTRINSGTWSNTTNNAIYVSRLLNNGNVFHAGAAGKWQISDKNMTMISNGTWIHGAGYDIIAMRILSNEDILLAGGGGKWQLLDSNMVSKKSGTWSWGTSYSAINIHLMDNGDILLFGGSAYWHRFDSTMTHKSTGQMVVSVQMHDSIRLDNGQIAFFGVNGYILTYTQEMNHVLTVQISTDSIYTACRLPNGLIMLGTQYGKYEIRSNDTSVKLYSGSWHRGTGGNIFTSKVLQNNEIMIAGASSSWEIFPLDKFMIENVKGSLASMGNIGYYSDQGIVELPNGDIFMSGTNGEWTVINSQGSVKRTGMWNHSSLYPIRVSLLLSTGEILMAGAGGKWEILNPDFTSKMTGTWIYGDSYIYTALETPEGKIMFAGSGGNWQLLNPNMTNYLSGTWGHGSSKSIFTSIILSTGEIVCAGALGAFCKFTVNMGENASGTWTHGTGYSIYNLFNDNSSGSLLMVGASGYWQVWNIGPSLSGSSYSNWAATTSRAHATTVLNNGNLLMVGENGKWQVYTSSYATVSTGTWIWGNVSINTAKSLSNGDIVLAGDGGKFVIISNNYENDLYIFSLSKSSIKANETQSLSWNRPKESVRFRLRLLNKDTGVVLSDTIKKSSDLLYDEVFKNTYTGKNFVYRVDAINTHYNGYYIGRPLYTPTFILKIFESLMSVSLPSENNIFAKENMDTIRTKVNEFRQINGFGTVAWTDPDIVKKSTPVKAIHLNEIQNAIVEVYTGTETPIISQVEPTIKQEVKSKDSMFPIKEYGNRISNIIRALTNK